MSRLPQALVVLAMVAACSPSGYLAVDVRTDLRPGIDFERVVVTLDGRTSELAYDGTSSWSRGVRAAEFDRLADGTYQLDVALFSAQGLRVVGRPVTVRQRGATSATILLARQCLDVSCEALNRACHFGRCVDPECSEERREQCGEPQCTSADDCSLTADGCLVPTCTASGGCWLESSDEGCGSGQVCGPSGVCLAAPVDAGARSDAGTPSDGGAADASGAAADSGPPPGPRTFGELCWDAANCEYQASVCPGGQADVACDWAGRQPCSDGLTCISVESFVYDYGDPYRMFQVAGAGLFCTRPCTTNAECVAWATAAGLPSPVSADCVAVGGGSQCDLHLALGFRGCGG